MNCVSSCVGAGQPDVGTDAPNEYAAMIACQAAQLTSANYICSDQPLPDDDVPGPAVNTACDAAICAWSCLDNLYSFLDQNMRTHCASSCP